ncbi:GAF and ANTAR domain-containing protein [Kitasatospora sp. NPDC048365]|uniref:GAF and ANTAR domain-containing protein n=1 Tax=Kitasatospora sp. NPDC048365 TaxID=3364050 RepID=UPI00371581E6
MNYLARVAQLMAEAADPADAGGLPRRLCAACVRALDLRGAAISVMTAGTHGQVLSASDEAAAEVERAQHTLGEGPCVDAYSSGLPVLVGDLAGPDGDRWPVLAAMLAESGAPVRGVAAFPLGIGGRRMGVLGLYPADRGTLVGERLAGARLAADAASLALAGSLTGPDPSPPWLAEPTVDGVVVDQAVGMVMVQLGVGPETALARLRAHSFATGRSVDLVAGDVVGRTLRFAEED